VGGRALARTATSSHVVYSMCYKQRCSSLELRLSTESPNDLQNCACGGLACLDQPLGTSCLYSYTQLPIEDESVSPLHVHGSWRDSARWLTFKAWFRGWGAKPAKPRSSAWSFDHQKIFFGRLRGTGGMRGQSAPTLISILLLATLSGAGGESHGWGVKHFRPRQNDGIPLVPGSASVRLRAPGSGLPGPREQGVEMVRTVHFDALRGGFRNLMGEKLGEVQCGNFSRGSDPLSSRRTRGSLALPSGCLCCLASVGIAPHAAHRVPAVAATRTARARRGMRRGSGTTSRSPRVRCVCCSSRPARRPLPFPQPTQQHRFARGGLRFGARRGIFGGAQEAEALQEWRETMDRCRHVLPEDWETNPR
jgi:hypothetical protein